MFDEQDAAVGDDDRGGRFSDPSQEEDVVAYNTRVARFLAAMGVYRIVFGPRGPRNGPTDMDGLRQMARTIDEAARRTADLGVLTCVHPHLGTDLQDRNDLDAVMDRPMSGSSISARTPRTWPPPASTRQRSSAPMARACATCTSMI